MSLTFQTRFMYNIEFKFSLYAQAYDLIIIIGLLSPI
jgi:hypothetical protein